MGILNSNEVAEIEALNELKFRTKQQAFFRIISSERKLRAQLAQLTDLETGSAKSEMTPLQHIGADILWKNWVNRTRASLNMELAQILAQKEMLRDDVRKDFAKVATAAELVVQLKSDELKKSNQKKLSDIMAHHQIRQLCGLP
jgi:hypothetical protein